MRRFCLLGWLLLLLAAPSFANMITNGDFETPIVPVDGFLNYGTGSTLITGWTVIGRQVSIVSGSYFSNGAHFPAESGVQWLDLTGDVSNQMGEGVTQTVATTPGQVYQLSYWLGNVTAPGYGTTSTASITVNGTVTFTDTNSTVSPTLLVWQQFTHTFTAAGTSTTIGFLNEDPSSDNSNGIDNVVLTPVMSSIPEPTSLLLFVTSGLGLFLRRKPW